MQLPDVPNALPRGLHSLLLQAKLAMERWGNARKYLFAYDGAGGLTLPTDWVDVTFDTVSIVDADTFRFANGVLTVLKDCRVRVVCEMSAATSTDERYSVWRLVKDTGNGFSEVPGARSYAYHRTGTVPYGSASINMILNLKADMKIKLQGQSSHATEVTTVADTCRFFAERVIYGD